MQKIVECVPNFSEGRDRGVIDQIALSIKQVEGVTLLDVDPGADTNRTVVTFVGDPEAVVEGAFQAIKQAAELIDMRKHSGAHARMGATDVCPFIPVSGVTMEDCAELSRKLGERVGNELNIPVYLYEFAAATPERENLATIRAGEYEGLDKKLKDPQWKPDFGEATFNPKSGATVIGARKFLIAYNVNLNTRDKKKATDIALEIREAGRNKRDPVTSKFIRDEDGVPIKRPGTLKAVKAVGWYIDEYNMAQISMNLVDMDVTPIHMAFDEVAKQADLRGLRVSGSELVGLIPLAAMLEAGRYFLKKQNSSTAVSEAELIRIAIQSMGLNEISPFNPEERIIEYQLGSDSDAQLVQMGVTEFVDELASDSPAPGGGSVSALASAMSAGLTNMVGVLTFNKKGYEDHWEEIERLSNDAQALKDKFLKLVDEDTESFNQVLTAMRLPKDSDEEIATRDAAIQEATIHSANIPLQVVENSLAAMKLAARMAEIGNQNSLSDAGVAILQAQAGLEGAAMNVLINIPGIEDKSTVKKFKDKVTALRQESSDLASKSLDQINTKLLTPNA
ncbi:MAG: glutamate formimidoyltransferase [Candidatus Marinimicrobia bacterium]|nr:glutamate formimidoyltransferase [Candidatus Neomarinimicrobiota bacterium]MCF7904780.1 glutamate formimidoyltransferase [Candidatus Neomarinimicrobiota bacterium]